MIFFLNLAGKQNEESPSFLAGLGQISLRLHLLEELEDIHPTVDDEEDEREGDETEELEEMVLEDGHQDGGHQGRRHGHHMQHQPVHQIPSAKNSSK